MAFTAVVVMCICHWTILLNMQEVHGKSRHHLMNKTVRRRDPVISSSLEKFSHRRCSEPVSSYTISDLSHLESIYPVRTRARILVYGMIFDCEEWMLEIKLNEVGPIIDYFILVEGAFTLQNTRRAQCFPSMLDRNEQISQWRHKIIYVYDDESIQSFSYWEAEVYYRDLIGIKGLPLVPVPLFQDDLIIITDIDELPAKQFLYFLKWRDSFPTLIKIRLLWSYYGYQWINPNTVVLHAVASIGELGKLGNNRTNGIRFNLLGAQQDLIWSLDTIVGWHCSWCFPIRQFINKIEHFAHSELNQAKFKSVEFLSTMREEGLWFPDSSPNGCLQQTMQIPEYVSFHLDDFRYLLGG